MSSEDSRQLAFQEFIFDKVSSLDFRSNESSIFLMKLLI